MKVDEYWSVKVPEHPIFKICQSDNSILVSAHSRLLSNVTKQGSSLTLLAQKDQFSQQLSKQQGRTYQRIQSIYNLRVYDISKNNRLFTSPIEDRNTSNLFRHFLVNERLLSFPNYDYVCDLQPGRAIAGYLGTSHLSIISYEQSQNCEHEIKIANELELTDNVLCGISPHYGHKLLLTTTQDPDTLYESTSMSEYDIEYKSSTFTYKRQREALTPQPNRINNFCVLIGHINKSQNQAFLCLHDTRIMRSIVSILDSSVEDFANVTWMPHYHVIGVKGCQVVTVWGTPAAKNSHIIKLDMRCPLVRQILVKNTEHPKQIHVGEDKGTYWIIRNQYRNYRYETSILSRYTSY